MIERHSNNPARAFAAKTTALSNTDDLDAANSTGRKRARWWPSTAPLALINFKFNLPLNGHSPARRALPQGAGGGTGPTLVAHAGGVCVCNPVGE